MSSSQTGRTCPDRAVEDVGVRVEFKRPKMEPQVERKVQF